MIRDGRFWAPPIAAHAGLRLEEILQLRPDDIAEVDGVWCFRVRRGPGQILKTDSSVRDVPIHPLLIRLGLLKHAEQAREIAKGKKPQDQRLFPELTRGGPYKLFGYAVSKDFTAYRRAVGMYEPLLDFHSFRGTFNTHLLVRGVDLTVRGALLGHAPQEVTDRNYLHKVPMEVCAAAIARIDYGLMVDESGPAPRLVVGYPVPVR